MLRRGSRRAWRRLREPTDQIGLYFAVVLVPAIFIFLIADSWSETPDIVVVTGAALGTVWIWAIRALWLGVYVGELGLRIINPWKTMWVNWSEVEGFSMGYPEGHFRTDQPVLTTTSGQRIALTAIMAPQPWTRPNDDFAEQALKTLSSYLDTARANDFKLKPSTIK